MTTNVKRLGAIASAGTIGTADTPLYTCGAAFGAVVSTVVVTNTSASAQTYTLSVSTGTSLPAVVGRLTAVMAIAAGDTHYYTNGICLDTVNKYLLTSASAVTVGFQAFGSELT